jgi:hypothetical protein
MRTSEFFIILATIYLSQDMQPRVRALIGLLFLGIAAIIELFNIS